MKLRIVGRLLPLLVFGLTVAAEDAVPQPIDVGKDVSVFLAIPDLSKAIDNIEAIGGQFNPNVHKGQTKMILGMTLGDPGLNNLDTSKPVVAMVFKTPPANAGGPPPFAIYVPAKAAAPYDQFAQGAQLLSSYKNGVLIVAKTQDALTTAEEQLPAYQKIADAKIAADARIYVSVSSLLATYDQQIKAGVAMMQQAVAAGPPGAPAGMNAQAIGKVLNIELKALLEILNEVDSQQLDLTLKADSITVDSLLTAQKGSALADLFSAPDPGASKTLRVLPAGGSLVGAMRMNQKGYGASSKKILETLSKDPDFSSLVTPDLQSLFTSIGELVNGDLAFAFSSDATTPFKLQEAVSITDEKKYLDTMTKISALMSPDGPIGKFYADMGMKLNATFEKSYRKHGNTDVHRYKNDVDLGNLPPAQAAQMKAFMKDMDIAIVNNMVLLANDPADVDSMIDKALAGDAAKPDVSLESITVFGGGKSAYFDIDIIGFIKAIVTSMPGNPAAPMFAQLKASAPIVVAGSMDSGRLFLQTKIPLAPFVELVTLIQGAGAGRAQPPAPPPPDPKNEKF